MGQSGKPHLLLHACCAPCCTVALERLRNEFRPILYYYNPCVRPEDEYRRRLEAIKQLCYRRKCEVWVPEYRPDEFMGIIGGREEDPEGGMRCARCLLQRLSQSANAAAAEKLNFFTTSLTTGPNKPASRIFPIAERLARECDLAFVPFDFKEQGGFQRSVELSKELGLYRQNYCGCGFTSRA